MQKMHNEAASFLSLLFEVESLMWMGQTLKVIASPFWISMKGLRDFLFCLFFIGLDDVSP